tara:strand:+ start:226 stop:348 length:123 start_codon:yes stop_codon:yes gene_type:complete
MAHLFDTENDAGEILLCRFRVLGLVAGANSAGNPHMKKSE